MEMKAVTEYETPKYDTCEEKNNKIFRFIMKMPKVSSSVLFLFLLTINNCRANINIDELDPYPYTMDGCVRYGGLLHNNSVLIFISFISFISFLILSMATAIISDVKLRKVKDPGIKKLKKKKYTLLCYIFLGFSILSCIFYLFFNYFLPFFNFI